MVDEDFLINLPSDDRVLDMKKRVELHERIVEYALIKSVRARNMRITIHQNGKMTVTIPRKMDESVVEPFLVKKATWILEKTDYFKTFGSPRLSKKEEEKRFFTHTHQALMYARERIGYFNVFYLFRVHSITIRNQRTRWGSCSKKGNLSFNYKIVFLPPRLADYIIVHELCHLAELNHSQKFWRLIEKTIPDYLAIRKELKKTGMKY